MQDKNYNMFPDTFMCHKIVSKLVKDQKSIIDMGGIGRLGKFLPNSARVTDVNSKWGEDGCDLQFRNWSFDAAVSINVLEHINPSRRFTFISEALRVSRNCVVLCFPFQNAETCERIKRSIRHDHPIANDTLPNLNVIISWIEDQDYEYLVYYGMPIPLHIALISGMKVLSMQAYRYINHLLEDNMPFWLCNSSIAQTAFLVVIKNNDKDSFRLLPLPLG